jgi:hypothetical protein
MTRRRGAFAGALATAALVLGACTSTPEASPDRDVETKRFDTHPGSAAIYVYRPDFPAADLMPSHSVLWVGDRLLGTTLPRSYFRADVRPGTYLLRGDGPDVGQFALDAKAGEIYFVRLNVLGGTSRFSRPSPDTARREIVRCCTLLENWAPGQRPLLR